MFIVRCPIHHICINLLVPRYTKTNIGNPGNQQNKWGGFNLDTWISNIDFLYTGNQRINANMVNKGVFSVIIEILYFKLSMKT